MAARRLKGAVAAAGGKSRRRSGELAIVHAEELPAIDPGLDRAQAGALRQPPKLGDRVFVRIFGMDQLAGGETDARAGNADLLIGQALQVDFDATAGLAVEGEMREAVDIDGGAELAVDALQQVAVERGGDAGAVVVGGLNEVRILFQIDADYHVAAGAEQPAAIDEKGLGFLGLEIADRRAREEAEPLAGRAGERGQPERARIVGADGGDQQRGEVLGKARRRVAQMLARNVDGNIGGGPLQRFEQDARLAAGAAAELDEAAFPSRPRRDGRRVLLKDRDLGAGRVIFRKPADLLEQGRAPRVVEELAGDRLAGLGQAGEDGVAKTLLLVTEIVKAQDHLVAHELAVVLADRSGGRTEARICDIGTRRPFPHIAEHLQKARTVRAGSRGGAGMQPAAIGEIAYDRQLCGRHLPFRLARQALAGPAGKGVGLIKTDMTDRLRRVQPTAPAQRENRPRPLALAPPIERRFPALLAYRRPAVGEPEFGAAIAAILDEVEILAAGRRARGQTEGFEPDLVARRLIVKGETGAAMPDLIQPAGKFDPGERRGGLLHLQLRRLIARQQRVDPKDVLDIHQDQFLMLLLVVKAELDERRGGLPLRRVGALDEPRHRGADMVAIGGNRIEGRPRQQPALRPRVAGSDRLVIGVEQIRKGRVKRLVIRIEASQDEGFEEPARVR